MEVKRNPTMFVLSIYDGTLFDTARNYSFWAVKEHYAASISEMKKGDVLLFVRSKKPHEKRRNRVFAVATVSLTFQRYNSEIDARFGPTNYQLNWTNVDPNTYNHGIIYKDLIMTGDYDIYTGQRNRCSVINYTKNKYRCFTKNVERQYEEFLFSLRNPEEQSRSFKPITENADVVYLKESLCELTRFEERTKVVLDYKLEQLERSKRRSREDEIFGIIEESENAIKTELYEMSNAIIASRYYLETELNEKIIEEIDILTKSINYAIAESKNVESVSSNQVNPVIDNKTADLSVMVLVEEMRKINKENELVLDGDFETDDDSDSDSDSVGSDQDQDQDPIHEMSKYNCVIS